jgi:hypothetical protein
MESAESELGKADTERQLLEADSQQPCKNPNHNSEHPLELKIAKDRVLAHPNNHHSRTSQLAYGHNECGVSFQ